MGKAKLWTFGFGVGFEAGYIYTYKCGQSEGYPTEFIFSFAFWEWRIKTWKLIERKDFPHDSYNL